MAVLVLGPGGRGSPSGCDRNGFAAAALPKSVEAKTNLERGLSMRRYEEATGCYASTKLLSRRPPWA